jgi:hypothetical protein
MATEQKPEPPKTNFGKLVSGPRGMKGVEAAKNPDALAAWINYKRNAAKKNG